MTRAPSPRSVSSFAPELLALWLTGARQRHEVSGIGDWKDFVKLRQRLYSLRYVARETKHEAYDLMCKAKIGWKIPDDAQTTKTRKGELRPANGVPVTLVIAPVDDVYAKIIADSGVDIELNNVAGSDDAPPPRPRALPPSSDGDFLSSFIDLSDDSQEGDLDE